MAAKLSPEKRLLVKKAVLAIVNGDEVQHDECWRYPHQGDDPKSCPLLGFMLRMEYRSGTLIFIPDPINKAKRG